LRERILPASQRKGKARRARKARRNPPRMKMNELRNANPAPGPMYPWAMEEPQSRSADTAAPQNENRRRMLIDTFTVGGG
jgi:hypothetical protein